MGVHVFHHHVQEGSMPGMVGYPCADDSTEGILFRGKSGPYQGACIVHAFLCDPEHNGTAEIRLSAKEVVDGTNREFGALCDIGDGSAVISLFDKDSFCRHQNIVFVSNMFPLASGLRIV